jgi:hypothetical protein
MNLGKDSPLWRSRWHVIIIYAALIAVVALTMFTDIFRSQQPGAIPQIIWLLIAILILAATVVTTSKTAKIFNSLEENNANLEKVTDALDKTREVLVQINQNTCLSESVKAVANREADKQALREIVFDNLQQQDFEATKEIIDEISRLTPYQELAKQLRAEAEGYRSAGNQERINQVIEHIERLFDTYQWAKASALIERLIKAEPLSENAKAMRQQLIDRKNDRKKVLLTAWDDAVRRQATDRSLELLRDLDTYLTPNEGLALQEAARQVFRNKLHSLGVQFSLAVSERRWTKAMRTGEEIMQDFPNSKMAEEIREKLDILRDKASLQPEGGGAD